MISSNYYLNSELDILSTSPFNSDDYCLNELKENGSNMLNDIGNDDDLFSQLMNSINGETKSCNDDEKTLLLGNESPGNLTDYDIDFDIDTFNNQNESSLIPMYQIKEEEVSNSAFSDAFSVDNESVEQHKTVSPPKRQRFTNVHQDNKLKPATKSQYNFRSANKAPKRYFNEDEQSINNSANKISRRYFNDDEESMNKNDKSMSKNAIAARENREKKKKYINDLERSVCELTKENTNLKINMKSIETQAGGLREENIYLKSVLSNVESISELIQHMSTAKNVKFIGTSLALDLKHQQEKPNLMSPNSTVRKSQRIIDKKNQPGICFHVNNNNVSLEFCRKCNENARQTLNYTKSGK